MTLPSGPSAIHPTVPGGLSLPRFTLADYREQRSGKIVWTYYGDKGVGKTTRILRDLPGRKLVVSLDNNTEGVKEGALNGDPNVWVINGTKYYRDREGDPITASAVVTVEYIRQAIDLVSAVFHPHWVIFDGTEILNRIAENAMRYKHGLLPSQGFKELSWWKDRTAIMNDFHRRALDAGELGMGYTAYYAQLDADHSVAEGLASMGVKTPKWVGAMFYETHIAIECRASYSAMAKQFSHSAFVLTAKPHLSDIVRTGQTFDVSGGTDNPAGKPIPFGPGLARRFAQIEERLKGVPITRAEVDPVISETQVAIPSVPPSTNPEQATPNEGLVSNPPAPGTGPAPSTGSGADSM